MYVYLSRANNVLYKFDVSWFHLPDKGHSLFFHIWEIQRNKHSYNLLLGQVKSDRNKNMKETEMKIIGEKLFANKNISQQNKP